MGTGEREQRKESRNGRREWHGTGWRGRGSASTLGHDRPFGASLRRRIRKRGGREGGIRQVRWEGEGEEISVHERTKHGGRGGEGEGESVHERMKPRNHETEPGACGAHLGIIARLGHNFRRRCGPHREPHSARQPQHGKMGEGGMMRFSVRV